MTGNAKKSINRNSLPIAIEEAEELHNYAMQLDMKIQSILKKENHEVPIGKIITANILIGLSIEIYLKAFMLAGREKGIKFGHQLTDLYNDFPEFLKAAIEQEYASIKKDDSILLETGFLTSDSVPEPPETPPFNSVDFDSFKSSLEAISNTFVESRYFFEQVTTHKWAIIKYYFASASNIAKSLEKVLTDYRNGVFKGKVGI
ncbi:hypothetical protein [Marinoscillum furvescens]|uniref:HEPN domain-containing protein n=1 Tax=Marinoscillum furvescens DSM 4134 TaxID=1122208 RepID=A0A3D9KWZ7_MARFU|nr:hypothetical protein [Marinoscillum furvescens]RED92997.1 hypothetical protein C7460_12721 [Marinoscillum furvescens DSM 4134]